MSDVSHTHGQQLTVTYNLQNVNVVKKKKKSHLELLTYSLVNSLSFPHRLRQVNV